MKRLIFLVLALLSWSSQAFAAFYYQLNFLPVNSIYNPGDATQMVSDLRTTSWDFRSHIGWTLGTSFFVGASGNFIQSSSRSEGSVGLAEVSSKCFEVGPALGIALKGLHFIGSYFFLGSYTKLTKNPVTPTDYQTKDTGVSGFQVDLGYSWNLTERILLGPSVVYRRMSYKKRSINDNVTPTNNGTNISFTTPSLLSGVTPMLTLVIKFPNSFY